MRSIQLETERLLLRAVREADVPAIYAYRSRADVCKYQTRYRRLADARRLIKRVRTIALNTPNTWHQFAVIEKVAVV